MSSGGERQYHYQAIYSYLTTLIAEATGERKVRLPSLRDLASRMGVSVSTVQHAYQLLESEGRVISVAKSGYYAVVARVAVHAHTLHLPLPQNPPESSPAGDRPAEGQASLLKSLYTQACAPGMLAIHRSDPWPSDALGLVLTAREREIQRQHRNLASHPLGDPELRRELAAHYTRSTRHHWCSDDVVMGADLRGIVEVALSALELRNRRVLVLTPASPVLLAALEATGARLCEVAMDCTGMPDLKRIAHLLQTRDIALMVISSALNGPQGTVMPDEALRALAALLNHHGTRVLDNDDHGALCFAAPVRFREWVDPARLLICGSFSRTIGAEARYGYLLAGSGPTDDFMAAVGRSALQRDFQLPPVRQKAIARMYRRDGIERHLAALRPTLQRNLVRLVQQLDDHLGEWVSVPMPAGGCGVWLRSRYAVDTRRVYEHMLERRILLAPGQVFSTEGNHHECLRIACPVNGLKLPGRVLVELRKALQKSRR